MFARGTTRRSARDDDGTRRTYDGDRTGRSHMLVIGDAGNVENADDRTM